MINHYTNTNLISERDVEAKLLPYIFRDQLGYNIKDLKYDYPVSFYQGREKVNKQIGLVIFFKNKPVIVVEAKNPKESIKYWLNQVDSYSFALKIKYSVITNGTNFILRGYFDGNSRISLVETNIDKLENQKWESIKNVISIKNIENSNKQKSNFVDEVNKNEVTNFRTFFKNLHNEIRDKEKLDPLKCFDELSKLLFIKIAELETEKSLLTPEKIEYFENISVEEADQYIQGIFRDTVKKTFPNVFDTSDRIEILPSTVKALLYRLEGFKLKDGKEDVKGRAFEEFLPTQLRGKGLGQFFTPRLIVDFMVKMANVSIHDIIVDFSCGSGGFLIKAFEMILSDINKLPSELWGRIGKTKNEFLEEVKKYNLHGIDAEPRATRIAKMNMTLWWGDGNRVVRGNGLDIKDKIGNSYQSIEYSKDYDDKENNKTKSGCSLILANPPFGLKESIEKPKKGESTIERQKREERNKISNNILSRYELGIGKKTQKSEILFIEKGIKLLRPQGKMFIVIPDSILSSKDYDYVRDFIMKNADIKAIISLPNYAFVQSGVNTINTSILYIEKFTENKKKTVENLLLENEYKDMPDFFKCNRELSYKIFMAIAEYIGFEPNGTPIKGSIQTDLDLILKDFVNSNNNAETEIDIIKFVNNIYVNKGYAKGSKGNKITRGVKNNDHISYFVNADTLENRIDPRYYFFKNNTKNLMKNFVKLADYIKQSDSVIIKKNFMERNKEYGYISCTSGGLCKTEEILNYDNIAKQTYKIVKEGDIVYNPSRLNIGSIGIVDKNMAGCLVSGSYEVFKCRNNLNAKFLIDIIKTPLYRFYIYIISTGTIRNSVDINILSTILIPKLSNNKQLEVVKKSNSYKDKIKIMENEIKLNKNRMLEEIQNIFK